MKNLVSKLAVLFLFGFGSSYAQNALWLRYPAISPNGKTIAFSYQGDIYTVPASGGNAQVLTLNQAHDFQPIWSRDGKTIAFASNRYGNFDVFTIPATGGKSTRLTFHSANDYPSDFTPDGSEILFSSARLDLASNQQFPSGALPELYKVPVVGGRIVQLLTVPAKRAKVSTSGKQIIYYDSKGYEDTHRKHHTSSVTRDIWLYDVEQQTHTQLSAFNGEDLDPVFSNQAGDIYYLSEQTGSFNVHQLKLNDPTSDKAITTFEKHPVRHLSIASSGLLCYGFHGEIYTQSLGESPQKVTVNIAADARYNPEKIIPVNSGVSDMAISPNGKEIAFIKRGEVFVSSIKEGTTKRITNTPEQERGIDFSPDGRSLLYASERNKSWNLYQTTLAREEEKYFFNATLLTEETLLETSEETFQATYSPNGDEVAFLERRTALKVLNLKSKEVREIMPWHKQYSYADGDQHYDWSPDGKWFFVNFLQKEQWIDQPGLVSADGEGEILNLMPTGYGAHGPQWMMDGKVMMWVSGRNGMKSHASWGSQHDVYAMYLTQEAWDRHRMNEEDFELWKENKEEAKKEDEDKKKDKDEKELTPVKIELEGREDRISRLTVHSSSLSGAIMAKDGAKLYYLAKFEKGYNLWETNLRTRETKILSKLQSRSGGGLAMNKEGTKLFVLAGGKIKEITLASGESKSLNLKGEMILNEMAERTYLYEHVWRQVREKFYRIDIQGVDWDFYKTAYASFLPHINNNTDFAEMLSEMLGELNASHTGARYRSRMSGGDQTASLGVFYDWNYNGNGLKISEVIDKSPLFKNGSKISAGVIIEKIDGQEINANSNFYPMLNRKAGKNTLLALYNPKTKKRWEETVKPISIGTEYQLRYERWVKNCDSIVNHASKGRAGYVHVRGMDDGSFRRVYETALGKHHNKEALVVDTRFNGGGWLHDDLATFLSGKEYIYMRPRDQNLGTEPQFKWSKTSVVVMNEANYSDAHLFPFTYKALGIGKLVGMPVAGTGTAVWWEGLQNGVVFGIPQVGMIDKGGNYMENTQLEPDIKVANPVEEVIKGHDTQLEEAVKEALRYL